MIQQNKMKPVVSKEKLPKVFFPKRDRYQNSRRSLAPIPYEHLHQLDQQIDSVSQQYDKIDEASMQSLSFLNTQRDTPSFGGHHLDSHMYYRTRDTNEEKLPDLIFNSLNSQQTARSKISNQTPYITAPSQEQQIVHLNQRIDHTSSTPQLPTLNLASQRETPSFHAPVIKQDQLGHSRSLKTIEIQSIALQQ